MLADLVSTWDLICASLQGFWMIAVVLGKFLFLSPFLPITILGIIKLVIKRKFR